MPQYIQVSTWVIAEYKNENSSWVITINKPKVSCWRNAKPLKTDESSNGLRVPTTGVICNGYTWQSKRCIQLYQSSTSTTTKGSFYTISVSKYYQNFTLRLFSSEYELA